MDHSLPEKDVDHLIERTQALSWGISPPPSWKDPVEAEHAADLLLVGRVIVDREMPLHAIRGVLSKAWPFAVKVEFSDLDKKCFPL